MTGISKPPPWNWSFRRTLAAKLGLPEPRFLVPFWEGGGRRVADVAQGIGGSRSAGVVWGGGRRGSVLAHTATTDQVSFGDSTRMLPTGPCTIILDYQKQDAVNRGALAFAVDASRCSAQIPWSDGVVSFDYGGFEEGATRLSVSGLTFGADLWAFTAGARGMEIWQNGARRASNAGTPTRTASTAAFVLGGGLGGATSDLANYGGLLIFHQQLPPSQIQLIHAFPYLYHCRASHAALLALQSSGALRRLLLLGAG